MNYGYIPLLSTQSFKDIALPSTLELFETPLQSPGIHDPFKKTMQIVGARLLKETSSKDPLLGNSQPEDNDGPLYKYLELVTGEIPVARTSPP